MNVDAGSLLNKVDVRLVPTEKAYSRNGPVACRLIIFNGTSQDLQYLDMPIQTELFFDTGKDQGIKLTSRAGPSQVSWLGTYLTLKAGSTLDLPINLNRYFIFDKPGDYSIPYFFFLDFYEENSDGTRVSVKHTDENESTVWSGTVEIVVRPVSAAVLTQELAAESRKLVSPDAAIKIQAAEALNFLDTPLVVPYLKAILTMPNAGDFPEVEMETLQALNRIGTPETLAVIDDALPNLDGRVAEEAVYELMDKKMYDVMYKNIVLSEETIKSLLSSFDSRKRHVAVNYLAKFGDSHDIPLLEPLRKDISLDVAKAANDGIAAIQDKK